MRWGYMALLKKISKISLLEDNLQLINKIIGIGV